MHVRYVSGSGTDNNSCGLSLETACAGVIRAVTNIKSQMEANEDGTVLRTDRAPDREDRGQSYLKTGQIGHVLRITYLLCSSEQHGELQGHPVPDPAHDSSFLLVRTLFEGTNHLFRIETISDSLTIENQIEAKRKEDLNVPLSENRLLAQNGTDPLIVHMGKEALSVSYSCNELRNESWQTVRINFRG
ncbi:hypothetical protein BLNAU_12643 [Blattamonas nauphoetae]|uniref:Uncharacterized protein n=1 Tax=Blattamonas nauphoetae TaxID=2049346 RepID=A0ABQ9XK52_9EUKA|nr:hypothetical protein BLNAU_12643 [Blattamonas nauphoetae]